MDQLAKDIYLETGYEGVNVGAIITTTGVICIDTPSYARDARDWAARLHRLSPYPIQQIILTDCNGDRVLHTRWLNAPIVMQQDAAEVINTYDKKYPQTLIDSLTARNPHRARELSNGPVERAAMTFSHEIAYYKSGHEINLISAPGPTSGNCWVALPRTGIIFTGDSLVVDAHPLVQAPITAPWLASLRRLADMRQYHTIVPGRGPLAQIRDIERQISYLELLRARVAAVVESGHSGNVTDDARLAALNGVVPELAAHYPAGDVPPEWLAQQLLQSALFVYEEMVSPPPAAPPPRRDRVRPAEG